MKWVILLTVVFYVLLLFYPKFTVTYNNKVTNSVFARVIGAAVFALIFFVVVGLPIFAVISIFS